MNRDIRIDIRLVRHWKFRKLKRLIGPCALEHLICFWGTIAEQVPNGALNGWSNEDIEDAATWTGESGTFVSSMVECGFLDVTSEGFYPHDWEDHQTRKNNWYSVSAKQGREIRKGRRYKTWRKKILLRDGFICQQCGHKDLHNHVHHIRHFHFGSRS